MSYYDKVKNYKFSTLILRRIRMGSISREDEEKRSQ